MTTAPTDPPSVDPDSPIEHDVAIIGAGASGLAAAVFTARYGLKTTIFDGGKAAITQCAHIENYLGFPGGISPDRFLELGRTQAVDEGAEIIDERVTKVSKDNESYFSVETNDKKFIAHRVVVAAAYDRDVLGPLVEDLQDSNPFAPTKAGRTKVDGLYVAGWMSDETVHQVGVNAGHGARTGLELARDDMSERYWPAVGERYIDWVVHEGRYGGDGWDEHVEEWFEDEILSEDHALDEKSANVACEDLKAEFLNRSIRSEESRQRDRDGQRQMLAHLDNDLVREYANTLEQH